MFPLGRSAIGIIRAASMLLGVPIATEKKTTIFTGTGVE
jgi:hypothetical protein